jgi:hypothetical protein
MIALAIFLILFGFFLLLGFSVKTMEYTETKYGPDSSIHSVCVMFWLAFWIAFLIGGMIQGAEVFK